jgi:hypothetical protein
MVGLVILLLFLVLPMAAFIYGVDSRDGSADPRRPASPVGIR